jgi:hypothetical protein
MRAHIFIPNLALVNPSDSFSGNLSRKLTRTCVPMMVMCIGHNWDAATMQPLNAPIVFQTMVVLHKIAGIESYEEYDELRDNRRAAEKPYSKDFRRQITGAQRPFVTGRGN